MGDSSSWCSPAQHAITTLYTHKVFGIAVLSVAMHEQELTAKVSLALLSGDGLHLGTVGLGVCRALKIRAPRCCADAGDDPTVSLK